MKKRVPNTEILDFDDYTVKVCFNARMLKDDLELFYRYAELPQNEGDLQLVFQKCFFYGTEKIRREVYNYGKHRKNKEKLS